MYERILSRRIPARPVVFFASLMLVAIRPAAGQDTLPVYEEPFHHLVFSNDEIRILDVRLEPGDTSAWHLHRNAITYIGLEGSRIWLDVPGEHPRSVYLPDDFWGGDIEYPEAPFIHRIANVGYQPFRLIAIEHLYPRRDGHPTELDTEGWETLDINPYFSISRTTIQPRIPLHDRWDGPALLVCRGKGQLLMDHNGTTSLMQSGDWRYWPREAESFRIENPGPETMEILLIRL